MKKSLLIIILISLFLISGCVQQGTRYGPYEKTPGRFASEKLIVEFELFSKIPETFKISPDSRRFAYLEKKEEKQYIVLDGEKEKQYDGIDGITFSPDSKRLAYAANDSGKWFVVVDGKEEKHYEIVKNLVFSSDSKRLAYAANNSGKWFVVVDGKEEKQYESVKNLVFSPDRKRLAYAANNSGKWFVVVDGKEEQGYDDILQYTPVFSPDSKKVAYAAKDGEKWFVAEIIEVNKINQNKLVLSPYRKDLAAENNVAFNEFSDRKLSKSYDGIIEGSLFYSPDNKHLLYGVLNGDKQFVVLDETDGTKYDFIIFIYDGGAIVFDSLDRFHYLARKGGDIYLVEETTTTSI